LAVLLSSKRSRRILFAVCGRIRSGISPMADRLALPAGKILDGPEIRRIGVVAAIFEASGLGRD